MLHIHVMVFWAMATFYLVGGHEGYGGKSQGISDQKLRVETVLETQVDVFFELNSFMLTKRIAEI